MCICYIGSIYYLLLFIIVAILSFGQSRYLVNEDDGSVQLLLILSNRLSITVTIEVFNTVGLATSKYQ